MVFVVVLFAMHILMIIIRMILIHTNNFFHNILVQEMAKLKN